jgi:hypothetical protein
MWTIRWGDFDGNTELRRRKQWVQLLACYRAALRHPITNSVRVFWTFSVLHHQHQQRILHPLFAPVVTQLLGWYLLYLETGPAWSSTSSMWAPATSAFNFEYSYAMCLPLQLLSLFLLSSSLSPRDFFEDSCTVDRWEKNVLLLQTRWLCRKDNDLL